MNVFFPRLFELYSGLWIILFVLLIESISYFSKKIYRKIKLFKLRKLISFRHFFYYFYISSTIIVAGFFYITNFERVFLDFRLKFNDYQCDCFLFSGSYFYQKQYIPKSGIFIEETNLRFTYLIFNPKIEIYLYNFTKELHFSKFITDFLTNNCKYVIFNISTVNNDFKINFSQNFQTLYINEGNYTFAEFIS